MERIKLWRLLAGATAVHAVVILLLTPIAGDDHARSPEALIEKARDLREAGKLDASVEAYQMALSLKPQVPAIFAEAEKEMHETRLAALKKGRRIAASAAEGKEQSPESPKPGEPPTPAKPPPKQTDKAPKVDLPALPDIEGEL